jgi:hypothetical protein
MLKRMIGSKFILVIFSILEWLLAWSARFMPNRNTSSALLKGVMALIFGGTASGGVIAEILLYRSLTGLKSLKDDNFAFAIMIVQGLGMIAMALNSESVLKRRERETHLGE